MSVVELEQFILSMRDSVRSHLQSVDPENVAFIAHLLTQELYNVSVLKSMAHSQLTVPSENDLQLLHSHDTLPRLFLRFSQQNGDGAADVKELERKVTAVFPGKQSFFALFVLYADNPSLSMFLISGSDGGRDSSQSSAR